MSHPSAWLRWARNTSADAVEQHQHTDVGQPIGSRLEPDVHARGHATHVPDLQVEHDEVGGLDLQRGDHVLAGAHPADRRVAPTERRLHLAEDPVGIGRNEDHGHGRGYRKRCAPIASRPSRSCTSVARNGTRTTGAGATCVGEAGEVVLLARGDELRSRRGWRRARRGRCRRACAARSRVGLGEPVAEPRVHPVDDERLRPRCRPRPAGRRRTCASSTVSRRGDATSTNDGLGVGEQLEHARRPGRGSPAPCPRRPGRTRSRRRPPRRRRPSTTVRRNACAATFTAFMYAAGRRHQHAEEAVVEEAGEPARRVEEVERVARRRRVDDDEVEVAARRAARRASPSPCTPACPTARRRCCGRSGCRGCARPAPASRA